MTHRVRLGEMVSSGRTWICPKCNKPVRLLIPYDPTQTPRRMQIAEEHYSADGFGICPTSEILVLYDEIPTL